MQLSAKFLNLNAKQIGEIGSRDCYQTHIFEVWQNILYGTYYKREIYYAANMTNDLKSFLVENWNNCRDYAREFFADDLIQAAEYLYNQI